MKKSYERDTFAYYPTSEKFGKILIDAHPRKEILIRWGRGQNAVYLTSSQAVKFIQLSKDSDIN